MDLKSEGLASFLEERKLLAVLIVSARSVVLSFERPGIAVTVGVLSACWMLLPFVFKVPYKEYERFFHLPFDWIAFFSFSCAVLALGQHASRYWSWWRWIWRLRFSFLITSFGKIMVICGAAWYLVVEEFWKWHELAFHQRLPENPYEKRMLLVYAVGLLFFGQKYNAADQGRFGCVSRQALLGLQRYSFSFFKMRVPRTDVAALDGAYRVLLESYARYARSLYEYLFVREGVFWDCPSGDSVFDVLGVDGSSAIAGSRDLTKSAERLRSLQDCLSQFTERITRGLQRGDVRESLSEMQRSTWVVGFEDVSPVMRSLLRFASVLLEHCRPDEFRILLPLFGVEFAGALREQYALVLGNHVVFRRGPDGFQGVIPLSAMIRVLSNEQTRHVLPKRLWRSRPEFAMLFGRNHPFGIVERYLYYSRGKLSLDFLFGCVVDDAITLSLADADDRHSWAVVRCLLDWYGVLAQTEAMESVYGSKDDEVTVSILPQRVFFGLQENIASVLGVRALTTEELAGRIAAADWGPDGDVCLHHVIAFRSCLRDLSFVLDRFLLSLKVLQFMTYQVRVVNEKLLTNPTSGLLWISNDGQLEHFTKRVRDSCGMAADLGASIKEFAIMNSGSCTSKWLRDLLQHYPCDGHAKVTVYNFPNVIPPDPIRAAVFDSMTLLQMLLGAFALSKVYEGLSDMNSRILRLLWKRIRFWRSV